MSFLAAIFCCDPAPTGAIISTYSSPTCSESGESVYSESSESIYSDSSSDESSESASQSNMAIPTTISAEFTSPLITTQPRRITRPFHPASPSKSTSTSTTIMMHPRRVVGPDYPSFSTRTSASVRSTTVTTQPKRVPGPVYYPRWPSDGRGVMMQVLPVIPEVEEEE